MQATGPAMLPRKAFVGLRRGHAQMSNGVDGDKKPFARVRYARCHHDHNTQVMFWKYGGCGGQPRAQFKAP